MTAGPIRLGTRGSALAMVQARLVRDALADAGHPTELVVIETEGDRRAPDTAWGEGAFVAAIERALLDGRVDVAVHSAKDVPTEADPRLAIAAYLPRADPRDALVVRAGARQRRLADLASGTRVGTDSPRRTAFILASRPDLVVHPLHGNVDTRLRRLESGETDALILACAGLDRLGLADRIDERLDPGRVPPAPGQGAIALQVRRDDAPTRAICRAIDDEPTSLAVDAERAFLSASGGGCRSPIGALATISDSEIVLLGGRAAVDGTAVVRGRRRGPRADGPAIAGGLARDLDEQASTPAPRVLVARAAAQAGELVAALRVVGLDPVPVAAIETEIDPPGGALDRAAGRLQAYAWVVVTSANGARAVLTAADRILAELGRPAWAAIGSATAAILERAGIHVRYLPREATGAALAAGLPIRSGERVLVVRGDLAGTALADALRARGAEVDDVVGYRTVEGPAASRPLLRSALGGGPIAAVVLTSGSTARGLDALARAEGLDVRSIPAVCIGPSTADEASRAGFTVIAVSTAPDPTTVATTVAGALDRQPLEVSR